jgi:sugar lactone lactonase YvrE
MKKLAILFALVHAPCAAQVYSSVYTYAGAATAGNVDGPLLDSRFNWPYGICYDAIDSTLYVADGGNSVIRKIHDGIVTTVAGSGSAGDVDGQGTNASFNFPTGIFFKDGILYICDNLNNKIKQMDSSGNVTTLAGSGSGGFLDGSAESAQFLQPKSVAVSDAGAIYVADYENHRIRKIENGVVSTVAGTGQPGDVSGPALSAQLHRPRDLCIAGDGTVYFSDLMNHRIKRLTTGGMVEVVAGSGTAGWADGMGEAALLNSPVGIDWLSPNELLVMDSMEPRFRKVTTAGVVTTLAGSGDTGYLDGPETDAAFDLPQDVCKGANGDLYIVDRNNNCVRILYKSGNEPQSIREPEMHPLPLHPVPTCDQLTADLTNVRGRLLSMDVITLRGAVVQHAGQVAIAPGSGQLTFSAATLPAGTYCMVLHTSEGTYQGVFVRE